MRQTIFRSLLNTIYFNLFIIATTLSPPSQIICIFLLFLNYLDAETQFIYTQKEILNMLLDLFLTLLQTYNKH